jgi:hypothetical protein
MVTVHKPVNYMRAEVTDPRAYFSQPAPELLVASPIQDHQNRWNRVGL